MSKRLFSVPRWVPLITGVGFYTSIGLLFFAVNPWLRVGVFLSLLIIWRVPRISSIVITLACLITAMIEWSTGSAASRALVVGVGWGGIAGTLMISLRVYPLVFHGSDWAASALLLRQKLGVDVALLAFFLYRALPELEARIQRIARALKAYGYRAHRDSKLATPLVVLEGLTIYFLEVVDILLAGRRVAERRHLILLDAAKKWRSVEIRAVFGSWLVISLIVGSFLTGWAFEMPLV